MNQFMNLLTLAAIKGYRTFMVASVIALLALLHYFVKLEVPQDAWIGLFAVLVMCLRAGMSPAAVGLLVACLGLGIVRADTNGPLPYIVQSASLETHHGGAARSSGVGSITHLGVDYGPWAVESVAEVPLYTAQEHVRRSLGFDVLVKPWTFAELWEPFAVVGAGYYWGSDPYQCLAADVGLGVRFHASRRVWLQLDARDAVPYDGWTLRLPERFQIVSLGVVVGF